jgi:hypothetical protein
MNVVSTALPNRLLRVKRQAARLAELQTLQAAAEFRRAREAAAAARRDVQSAGEDLESRIRHGLPIATLEAAGAEMERLLEKCVRRDAAVSTAGAAYRAAVEHRRQVDAEIDMLEELLARRLAVLRKQDEQQRQQAADDWTLRRWSGATTEGTEP